MLQAEAYRFIWYLRISNMQRVWDLNSILAMSDKKTEPDRNREHLDQRNVSKMLLCLDGAL